jgi:WD40 repeat protein
LARSHLFVAVAAGLLLLQLALRSAFAQAKPADRLPVAFSGDGKLIAARCKDGHVRIWDAATKKQVKSLVRHTIKVCAIAFAPDSKTIFAGCEDGTVQVYSLASERGDLVAEANVANEVEPVTALAVSPDGNRFLVASQNRAVHLFEILPVDETRPTDKRGQPKLLRTFRRPAGAMAAVAFAPDGKRVLAGGSERVLVAWNVETKEEVGVLEGHKDLVTSVAFTPDGRRFLSASLDGTVNIYEAASGKLERSLEAHEGGVTAAVISRDSKLLVTGGKNGWWKTWDVSTGKFVKAAKGTSPVLSLDLSPDGTRIVTGGGDRQVRLWDAIAGKEIGALPVE